MRKPEFSHHISRLTSLAQKPHTPAHVSIRTSGNPPEFSTSIRGKKFISRRLRILLSTTPTTNVSRRWRRRYQLDKLSEHRPSGTRGAGTSGRLHRVRTRWCVAAHGKNSPRERVKRRPATALWVFARQRLVTAGMCGFRVVSGLHVIPARCG